MKEKKQIISLIGFSLLLTSWGYIQTDIKSTPQIVLIIYGSITFFTSLLKNKILFTILFYPLFTLLSYLAFFMASIEIMDLIMPNRGLIEIDGIMHGTNGDPYIFHEMIISLIISIAISILYQLKWKRNVNIEKYFVLGFSIVSLIVYATFE